MFFYVEMTDTFNGEANYSWVHRFKVKASTERGAILKAARETGFSGRVRKAWDSGDCVRHNVQGAAICFFTRAWDEHDAAYRVKEI